MSEFGVCAFDAKQRSCHGMAPRTQLGYQQCEGGAL